MSYDFHVGQLVTCIDALSTPGNTNTGLINGCLYEVSDIGNSSLQVRVPGYGNTWYAACRFGPPPHVVKAPEPVNGADAMRESYLQDVYNKAAPDNIHQPHHYARYTIEPVTFIGANKLPFDVGNVIKYVCRYDAKNGKEDVAKAKRYCEIILERIEREEKISKGEDAKEVWAKML